MKTTSLKMKRIWGCGVRKRRLQPTPYLCRLQAAEGNDLEEEEKEEEENLGNKECETFYLVLQHNFKPLMVHLLKN